MPIDSTTHLALMAKAKVVFESDDNFLSFPALSPISYKADQLAFGAFDSPNPSERIIYSEFSRIVNSIPSGTIYNPSESFLWDAYLTVLRTAIAAGGQTTEAEDREYDEAVGLMWQQDASGKRMPSSKVTAYQQYRTAWFNAVQNYKAQQMSALAATDAAAQSQWQNVDEPRLRGAIDQAQADWEANGFKSAIENAQRTILSHEARSPQATVNQWPSLFNPDVDLQTDPTGQAFAPTSYVPVNIFGDEWPTFRVSGTEISELVAQAPAELKDIFALDGTQPAVDEISFEYRSVALSRPWFRPDVFAARFWRLPDGVAALSDGAQTPHGSCPAYVAALVFARNIQVKLHPAPAAPPSPPQIVASFPALRLVTTATIAGPARMRLAAMPAAALHPVEAAVVQPQPARVIAANVAFRNVAFRRAATEVTLAPHTATPGPATPATPTPAPPQADARNDISVLAFVCKRLPKTPDPDPNLSWP